MPAAKGASLIFIGPDVFAESQGRMGLACASPHDRCERDIQMARGSDPRIIAAPPRLVMGGPLDGT